MDDSFRRSPYSFYFRLLTALGLWPLDSTDLLKQKLHFAYRIFSAFIVSAMIYMGAADLFMVLDNFRKVAYNLCVNIMLVGTWCKNIHLLRKTEQINNLRRKLHRDISTCQDEEEKQIFLSCAKDFRMIEKYFHYTYIIFFPMWLVLNYFSYKFDVKNLPLPSKWFFEVDLDDPKVYNALFIYQSLFTTVYIMNMMAVDLCLFSLLIQLIREYKVLVKKINDFSVSYENFDRQSGSKSCKEINVLLKKVKTKNVLRYVVNRQKQLLRYTYELENSYSGAMFFHIFLGGLLIVMNGLETMIMSLDLNIKMTYQYAYISVMLADVLYLCWTSERLSSACIEVGSALYKTPWYRMDQSIQKDLSLIILRSQSPPQITSGGFVQLNLHMCMNMMSNIYSWLALFRQIGFK